jgi:lysyl-tRNA synthetase class 2
MQELSEQELVRREKLAKLRELGIDPYPAAAFDVSHYATTVSEQFENGLHVRMSGRLMSRRVQGKASFAELQDATGRVQLYFNRDILCQR